MPEEQEREKLAQVIRQWNNKRLDLFEISQPDEVSRLQTPEPSSFSVHVSVLPKSSQSSRIKAASVFAGSAWSFTA